MGHRIKRLLGRLDRIECREATAIRAGRAELAVAWGILAGETWSQILTLAEENNIGHELPAPQGPLARSAPFGQYKEHN